jgi:hypothetical protein
MTPRPTKPKPGTVWRVQYDGPQGVSGSMWSNGALTLDEVAIGAWLHVEALGAGSYFVEVAGRCFWVSVDRSGKARITSEETR